MKFIKDGRDYRVLDDRGQTLGKIIRHSLSGGKMGWRIDNDEIYRYFTTREGAANTLIWDREKARILDDLQWKIMSEETEET